VHCICTTLHHSKSSLCAQFASITSWYLSQHGKVQDLHPSKMHLFRSLCILLNFISQGSLHTIPLQSFFILYHYSTGYIPTIVPTWSPLDWTVVHQMMPRARQHRCCAPAIIGSFSHSSASGSALGSTTTSGSAPSEPAHDHWLRCIAATTTPTASLVVLHPIQPVFDQLAFETPRGLTHT
jgi:hypothetical protein